MIPHVLASLCVSLLPSVSAGEIVSPAGDGRARYDWPQFEGPRRDNRSAETHLLVRWPEGGPKLLWRGEGLGHGWAGVAIAGARLYTAGTIRGRTVLTALDRSSGKRLWRQAGSPAFAKSPSGARATPTIADGRLYHLNGTGYLLCLDARTGKRVWAVNTLRQFRGRNIRWGLSGSALVDGPRVICCPGGELVSVVALDAATGKTVWTCRNLGDKPGYATAIVVAPGGVRQLVVPMSGSVVGIAAETGKLLWRYPHKVAYEAVCTSPVYHDGRLALFGTWGRGATLLKLTATGSTCTAKELWRTRELDNEHGGVVLADGHLYGQSDGNHKRRHLTCLEFATGKVMWTSPELAGRLSATLTFADGMLYMVSDRGEVALVRPSPKRLEIVSRFRLPKGGKGDPWARPVVCGGRLHLRHGEFLYVYDVARGPDRAERAGERSAAREGVDGPPASGPLQ